MSRSRLFAAAASAVALAFLLTQALAGQEKSAGPDDPPEAKPPAKEVQKPAGPPLRGPLGGPGAKRPGEFGPPRADRRDLPAKEDSPRLGKPLAKDAPREDRGPRPPGKDFPRVKEAPWQGPLPGGQPPGLFLPAGPPRWPHQDWGSLEKNDPEMYKFSKEEADLERRTRELAMQYRRAPAAERDEIKQQLEKLVNQHFDARQQRRQLEIKRIEEELQRLREAIDRRNKARKELVGKRVTELLGQEDEMGF